jgi:hypothetical protein
MLTANGLSMLRLMRVLQESNPGPPSACSRCWTP